MVQHLILKTYNNITKNRAWPRETRGNFVLTVQFYFDSLEAIQSGQQQHERKLLNNGMTKTGVNETCATLIKTYVMAIVWLPLHVLAAYNSKSPISEWCHRASCLQFGIRQIANGIHVLYVPVWSIKTIAIGLDFNCEWFGHKNTRAKIESNFNAFALPPMFSGTGRWPVHVDPMRRQDPKL